MSFEAPNPENIFSQTLEGLVERRDTVTIQGIIEDLEAKIQPLEDKMRDDMASEGEIAEHAKLQARMFQASEAQEKLWMSR